MEDQQKSSQTKQGDGKQGCVLVSPPFWDAGTQAWCLSPGPRWSREDGKQSRTFYLECAAATLPFVLLIPECEKGSTGHTFLLVVAWHAWEEWKGLSLTTAWQGSLGCEDKDLTPSSTERASNSYLFPVCSDQLGTRAMLSWGLDTGDCCNHSSVQLLTLALVIPTSHSHSVLVRSLPAYPVLSLGVRIPAPVVALVCKAGFPEETRAPFLGPPPWDSRHFTVPLTWV